MLPNPILGVSVSRKTYQPKLAKLQQTENMLTFYILEMQKTEDIFYFHLLYSQLETLRSRRCSTCTALILQIRQDQNILPQVGIVRKLKSSFRARCYNSQLKATIKEDGTINNLEE